MTITLTDLAFLQSETGEKLLADLAGEDLSEKHALKLITTLRKMYSQEQVSAALTMAKLRLKAVHKFGPDASQLFFTDDALQQASDPLVRQYRAQNIEGKRILDVCSSIGADSLAFAQAGAIVQGLDIDPVRIAIARHNAHKLVCDATFTMVDVTQGIADDYDLIFFDPARRDKHGKRIYNVEGYIPPLSLIEKWHAPQIMVKLAPSVDISQITKYGGEVQFISVNGDMKEAVLHVDGNTGLTAVLLSHDAVNIWHRQDKEPDVPITEPQGWLCEPDPSILRAKLVKDIAYEYRGAMLDETIAYFTTAEKPNSVWIRAWQIIDWMPFNLKKLRAYLRSRNMGTITVKKRGSPITPEELIRKLKLTGDNACTLVLTQYNREPIVLLCHNFI
ncbi:MAG: SAM-dependent methyltransferase [Anaerolineae bacterium]|nr:SAM-dependent methyltransferase [Anaerolineae bacterium]